MPNLQNLPYDLLLDIAQYVDLRDVHALQLTCTALRDFTATRSVFRKFAFALLRRCRPLPLAGFQRLSDLTTEQLMKSVNKATRFEQAWRVRTPRPIANKKNWYKIISAPPNEEIDWLSPITSSYILCATKSGKVICWDIASDGCVAEWNPGEKWELWKCRVEFEERAVYFTMAKLLSDPRILNDDRVMEFILMRLSFPQDESPHGNWKKHPIELFSTAFDPTASPIFSEVATFMTTGVVMNVFLLDPLARLLTAFIWVSGPNTIGLYTLLDWKTQEYVYIDTGIECLKFSNWSCILHEDQVVIHSEETDAAYQHFYPISLLRQHKRKFTAQSPVPALSARVSPARTQAKRFVYPLIPLFVDPVLESTMSAAANSPALLNDTEELSDPEGSASNESTVAAVSILATVSVFPPPLATTPIPTPSTNLANPLPSPPWLPESAHFVRQWWPTLPGVPRVSCTVILLADHDPETHQTRFAFAQHYFTVPFNAPDDERRNASCASEEHKIPTSDPSLDGDMMKMWYVSTPFDVVYVNDNTDDDAQDRPRPLVAVDFGHAVWVEQCDNEMDIGTGTESSDVKCLRFVTFPSMGLEDPVDQQPVESTIRTLELPDELDLDTVETINIDQSQGAVILSSAEGQVFFMFYT